MYIIYIYIYVYIYISSFLYFRMTSEQGQWQMHVDGTHSQSGLGFVF